MGMKVRLSRHHIECDVDRRPQVTIYLGDEAVGVITLSGKTAIAYAQEINGNTVGNAEMLTAIRQAQGWWSFEMEQREKATR